jgi:hypothetical protein
MIALFPFGRGDVDYRWMGETDVWESLAAVRDSYAIDPCRQYLTGLSMGGYATWRIACDYPEQWAAIAPICGGGHNLPLVNLRDIPTWCVHGRRDPIVPVRESRSLVRSLRRLGAKVRYSELSETGHNAWDWLYTPGRRRDSLAEWLLAFQKEVPPKPILLPKRRGAFQDLFTERTIISYPGSCVLNRETDLLAAEAHRLATFRFGDVTMRSGRFQVKADHDLNPSDLIGANLLILGRSDNHAVLRPVERRLLAKQKKGQLWVAGETYLGKALVAAVCQASPWNRKRLLGVIAYQQFHPMRGIAERLFGPNEPLPRINIYDTQQKRFIRQEA